MIALLALVFGAVVWTGPALDGVRARRRARREFAAARVVFLLPSDARPRE